MTLGSKRRLVLESDTSPESSSICLGKSDSRMEGVEEDGNTWGEPTEADHSQ